MPSPRLLAAVTLTASLAMCAVGCARGGPSEEARIDAALAAHPVDPSLQQDWVRLDAAAALVFKDALPPRGTPEAFVSSLRSEVPVTWNDLGFGLRAAHAVHPGGHMSCHAHVLALDGAFVEVIAECGREITSRTDAKDDSWPKIRPLVAGVLGAGFDAAPGWMRRRFDFPEARARADAARAAALGPRPEVTAPPDLDEAYATLTSPYDVLVIGTACGYGATKPRGRSAMESLVRAERADLIRSVLRGPNPGGRVYAAEALLARAPLEPADAAAVRAIRAMPIRLATCNGCMGEADTAAVLLHEP